MVRYNSPSETAVLETLFLHFDDFLRANGVDLPSPSNSDELHSKRFGTEAVKPLQA